MSERIHPNRRAAYRAKLEAHKLSMRKLEQLTRRLPNPDDAEVADIVVLDLVKGPLHNLIRVWTMESNR